MTILQAILLGVLQGATEFLPVSSSGHLVLVPWLFGWSSNPSLAFDVIVHWATALAVIAYFWRDWVTLLRAGLRAVPALVHALSPKTRRPNDRDLWDTPETRLLALLVLATVPAAVAGALFEDFFERMFARPAAAAAFLLVTAAILALSEWLGRRQRDMRSLTWKDALFVGIAQALAIFPGLSRSGATISAGMARGLRRGEAARFSFLLSTPIIIGAGVFSLLDLSEAGALASQAGVLIAGFLAAAVVGLLVIHLLLRFVQRRPLYVFAVYCAAMGLAALIVALVRGG